MDTPRIRKIQEPDSGKMMPHSQNDDGKRETLVTSNNVFSVIVPTFNRSRVICETLNAIRQQTHRPIEIVVIDDGSTDNTGEVVQSWYAENQEELLTLKYLWKENGGVSTARNMGFSESIGDYVQFLDSDDLIHPELFSRSLSVFENESVDMVVLGYDVFSDQDGKVIATVYGPENENLVESVLAGKLIVFPTRCVFTRELLLRNGEWNIGLPSGQDTEFIERALCLAVNPRGMKDSLSALRRGGNDHLSNTYKQLERIICAESLAANAYPLQSVSIKAKRHHLSKMLRMALRYQAAGEYELASRCLKIVDWAPFGLNPRQTIQRTLCRLGRPGGQLYVFFMDLIKPIKPVLKKAGH